MFLKPHGNVSNFTVLSASFFSNTDAQTLWCQSSSNNATIGEWYYPNGDTVTTKPTSESGGSLQAYHSIGQVALLRDGGIAGNEGLYKCVIPDEHGVNQTLWVGLYTASTYSLDASSKSLY